MVPISTLIMQMTPGPMPSCSPLNINGTCYIGHCLDQAWSNDEVIPPLYSTSKKKKLFIVLCRV